MYHPYFDLRERCGEPLWHDEHGVPRYVPFHPDHVGIYYQWVALLEIRCQSCEQAFLVADGYSPMDVFTTLHGRQQETPGDLDLLAVAGAAPSAIGPGWFSYGDAPWHGEDQCAGTTMTTSVYRVVEFWSRDGGPPVVRQTIDGPPVRGIHWRRRPEFELAYPEGA